MASTRRQTDIAKKPANASAPVSLKREPHTPPVATPQLTPEDEKAEENSRLIAACVAVLQRVHPEGLQTKDLSGELTLQDTSLEFTSSVLSSKLNSFFRRYHGDSSSPSKEQLTHLPITRKLNTDGPKRLVYTWHKPTEDSSESQEEQDQDQEQKQVEEVDQEDNADVEESQTVVVSPEAEDSSADKPMDVDNKSETPVDDVAQDDVAKDDNSVEEPAAVVAKPKSISEAEQDNAAFFGPSPASPEQEESRPVQLSITAPPSPPPLESPALEPRAVHYHKKRSHSVTFTSAAPATPPAEADEPVYKRRASFSPHKVNLYYDKLDFDFSPVAGLVLSQPGDLDLQDIEAPETLSPEDLMTMVV